MGEIFLFFFNSLIFMAEIFISELIILDSLCAHWGEIRTQLI